MNDPINTPAVPTMPSMPEINIQQAPTNIPDLGAPIQQAPVQEVPVEMPVMQAPDMGAPVMQQSQAPVQEVPVEMPVMQQAPVQEVPVEMPVIQQAPIQQTLNEADVVAGTNLLQNQMNEDNGIQPSPEDMMAQIKSEIIAEQATSPASNAQMPGNAAAVAAPNSFGLPIDINMNNQGNLVDQNDINNNINQAPAILETAITYEGYSLVGQLKSTFYSGLRTILEFLSQGMDSQSALNIKAGKLTLARKSGYIFCDLTQLFKDNDFSISNPVKYVKAMKGIKGGEVISFFKNEVNKEYLISKIIANTATTTLKIPMFTEDAGAEEMNLYPELGAKIFEDEMDIGTVQNLVGMKKTLEANNFIINLDALTNELISIELNEFSEIFKVTTNDVIKYKVFDPFPVTKAENLILRIFRKSEEGLEDKIWLQTASDVSLTTLVYSEPMMEQKVLNIAGAMDIM
jgi:hypothetical protein